MKRLNSAILLPLLLILALPLNAFAQLDSGYVTFGKSIYGVSIKHPADWEVKDSDRHTRDDKLGYDFIAELCPKSMIEHPDPDFYQIILDVLTKTK